MPKNKVENNVVAPLATKEVPWNPWLGFFLVFAIYVVSQIVGLVVLVYPAIRHFSSNQSSNWLNNSVYAQFVYVLIVEAFTVGAVLLIIKLYKARPNIIGLRRPKLSDPLYGLATVLPYYVVYFVVISLSTVAIKSLNVNQQQNVGFNSVHGAGELIATFISLVILPPIAEEILVRGFLYGTLRKGMVKTFNSLGFTASAGKLSNDTSKSSRPARLKKAMPKIIAALLTSVIFASAHLPEGTGGLLWVGFIDTFILSLFLVYLREKTNGLYAGMTLHSVKNLVAYYILYLAPLIQFHL